MSDYTLEQNKKDFKDILKNEGVLIHGFRGQFGFALSRGLLEKMRDCNVDEKLQITAITRESIADTMKGIIKHAITTSKRENINLSNVLRPFLTEESVTTVQNLNDTPIELFDKIDELKFSDRLNIINEPDEENTNAALIRNKIHILAIPSTSIEERINKTENILKKADITEKRTYVDTSKGDHEIPDEVKEQVVNIAGANFHTQMANPSGIDVSGDDEQVKTIAKLFFSKTLRPSIHKNPESVIKGRDWKNLAALTVGFLTEGLGPEEKAKISAEFFAIMIECGKEYGITEKDWISNSGVSDTIASLTEGRNFLAGSLMSKLDLENVEDIDSFIKEISRIVSNKRGEETTVESLNTLKKYLEKDKYKSNIVIEMFRKITSKENKKNLSTIRDEMKKKLLNQKRNKENIDERILGRIKELIKFLKFIVHTSGYRENTVGMIIHYGLREIYENFQDEIKSDNLIVILEEMLKEAFSTEKEPPNLVNVKEMAKFLATVSTNKNTDAGNRTSILQIIGEEANRLKDLKIITPEETKKVIQRIMEIPLRNIDT